MLCLVRAYLGSLGNGRSNFSPLLRVELYKSVPGEGFSEFIRYRVLWQF